MSKADRTKAFITEKTAAIFNKKGYAGTSLTDMTGATGLTKGSIYGNFEDKMMWRLLLLTIIWRNW